MDTGLKLLGEAVLLAVGAIIERPDAVLTALLLAEIMALCGWLAGWAGLILWIFDR